MAAPARGTVVTPGLRANAVIAGVPKAGTSSLFVTLSNHPQVAASSVKETRYFLPIRYGRAPGPIEGYEAEFAHAGDRPVRLEATPAYFYGGRPLAAALRDACGPAKVMVVLREPVARLGSFFRFQQARLRIPASMTLAQYVAEADRRAAEPLRDVADDVWFGLRGGVYADFLPGWIDVFGPDLRVLWFEELLQRPAVVLPDLATWLGIDRGLFPMLELASENRTTGFRNRGLQRVALGVNDRLERVLRRHHRLEVALRSLYYRLNGRSDREEMPRDLADDLRARYEEPNARLAAQLRATGVTAFPDWVYRSAE